MKQLGSQQPDHDMLAAPSGYQQSGRCLVCISGECHRQLSSETVISSARMWDALLTAW
jgi:hypothetical protein